MRLTRVMVILMVLLSGALHEVALRDVVLHEVAFLEVEMAEVETAEVEMAEVDVNSPIILLVFHTFGINTTLVKPPLGLRPEKV